MHARGSGKAARRAKRGRQPEKKKEIFLLKKKTSLIRLTARFLKTQKMESFIMSPHLIQPLIRNLENQNACDMSFWLTKWAKAVLALFLG